MTNANVPKSLRTSGTVDLLRVPRENVVDLRPAPVRAPAPPAGTLPRRAAPPSARRRSLTFALCALLLALPFFVTSLTRSAGRVKGDVVEASSTALDALVAAGNALAGLHLDDAQASFNAAETSFAAASESIGAFRAVADAAAAVLPFASSVRSGTALLDAGTHLARAGERLVALVTPWVQPAADDPQDFAALLGTTEQTLTPVLDELDAAVAVLDDVRERDLPEPYRQQLAALLTRLPDVRASLERIRSVSAFLLDVLGTSRTQRYLVLFQNNLELRATGGFLGSMALVDVAGGKVTKLVVPSGGTYDVQGQLSEKLAAPEPLRLVNPHWQLQDANWWPDFPTSARKVAWFYEKSGGPTVDGVLALTPNVVLDVLEETGPVDLVASYGVVITAENFLSAVLQQIDGQQERPKQILADLVPIILDRLVHEPTDRPAALLGLLERALAEKHLLFFFPDEQREERVRDLGWAGEVRQAESDYLQVVDSNIGGGKTDGAVDETIDHRAVIGEDGTVTVTVTVTRVHNGAAGDPFTGTRNVDYVRFFTPLGSTLLAAEGFERIPPQRFQTPDADALPDADQEAAEGSPTVDERTGVRTSEEFGKTVFGHWMGVAPGETARAAITYRLPFNVSVRKGLLRTAMAPYSLLVQKQPGTDRRHLVHTLIFPPAYRVQWQSNAAGALDATPTSLSTALPLTGDQLFAVLFGLSR